MMHRGAIPCAAVLCPALCTSPCAVAFGVEPLAPREHCPVLALPEPEDPPPPARPRYLRADSTWFTLGGGVAADSGSATDSNLHVAFSRFLTDRVEVVGEIGAWFISQEGADAVGLNGAMVFRWHFAQTERWTFFVDAGIGLLASTDDVPAAGTSLNFTPRAGAGFTRLISDDEVRLIAGVRWHHLSNARVTGDSNNPSRDAPMIYVGLVFPF